MQCGRVQIFKPAAEGDSTGADMRFYKAKRFFFQFVRNDIFKARSDNDEIRECGPSPAVECAFSDVHRWIRFDLGLRA
jgi:hypothetical protein